MSLGWTPVLGKRVIEWATMRGMCFECSLRAPANVYQMHRWRLVSSWHPVMSMRTTLAEVQLPRARLNDPANHLHQNATGFVCLVGVTEAGQKPLSQGD